MLIAIFIMLLVMLPILVPAIKRQLKKPEFDDEYMFDDFVCNDFFTEKKFEVIDPSSATVIGFGTDQLPGFRLRQISTSYEFSVITKYSSNPKDSDIIWCSKNQFDIYKNLADHTFYIIFGIGGTSYLPDKLFVVPFKHIISNKVLLSSLSSYEIKYSQEFNFNIN